MRPSLTLALSCGMLVVPIAAAAQTAAPRHFAPSSKWAMDYADDSCRLIRNFSDGKSEITVALERYAPGEPLAIGIAGNFDVWKSADKTSYAFASDQPGMDAPLQVSKLADGRSAYLLSNVSLTPIGAAPGGQTFARTDFGPPAVRPVSARTGAAPMPAPPPLETREAAELDSAGKVDKLIVKGGFKEPLQLDLGSMAAPLKAMQGCTKDLVAHWGVDADAHRKLTRPAGPADFAAFGQAMFLQKWAMGAGATSFARYRLLIDRDGKLSNCTVTAAGVPKGFSDDLCAAARRVAFQPALDADGQPIPSYYASVSMVKVR